MTWMLLARHGETEWNREGRWQGQTDVALNETGRQQARELAAWLVEQPLDVIVSSDLERAHETARIVAEAKRMAVSTDAGLREIDVGSWGGLTPDEIAQRFPGMTTHDGETNEQHLARVVAAFRRIAGEHRGKRILIVSHGKTLRVIRRHATGRPVSLLGNCETARLRFDGERFVDDWGERERER
jgi:broad specificity phosphatase PhoE